MNIQRCDKNPIINITDLNPTRPDLNVIGVFNPAAAKYKNKTILLLRVAEAQINTSDSTVTAPIYNTQDNKLTFKEFDKNDPQIDLTDKRLIIANNQTYLTSISHLKLASSSDGINFTIEDTPFMTPQNPYETFGIEDPRITRIDDTFYITYVAVSPYGVCTALASTTDFVNVTRHGIIFCPENKDVVIFPEKINGFYYALHRPYSPLFDKHQTWIAQSTDLTSWGDHHLLYNPDLSSWDSKKTGPGAPPFKTNDGFIEIYHGVDDSNKYCLAAILLDKNNPEKIIAKTKTPILTPQQDYETNGFYGNVVFTCGLTIEKNTVNIYYGAADTSICLAKMDIDDITNALQ